MTARQLPLVIPATPAYDEASFLTAESNEAARTWLGRTEVWPDRRLALWGEADRGKTHLLRIWAGRTGADVLDGPSLAGFPEVTSPGGAAVDDADRADEAALLHLLNTAHDLDRPVLLAARLPPARWTVTLRDLESRLRAITAVEVGAPEDGLMRRLLLHWLAERRLVADQALHDRLLMRLPRNPQILRAAVVRLDHDANASRRRTVTPAMVRAAIDAIGETGDAARGHSSPPIAE
ncbi:MAG: chromosomal replication initiator DnaA [Acetobacteraceae bacterium]